ncbi:MAG: M15 family metallopeptidase [Bauldia sp.]
MRQLGIAIAALVAAGPALAASPSPLVYLADIDPSIVQDMRYAGDDNFTGKPLPGYAAAECMLRVPVAEALKRVQSALQPSGLTLKVYDCYRPVRAVQAMVAWVGDGKPGTATRRYFPRTAKSALIRLGYIASRSAHSLGTTVDLGLARIGESVAAPPALGACNGPPAERLKPGEVDMGTAFDCFDETSATASPAVAAEAARNRATLVRAMKAEGFANYSREWWHFSLSAAGATALDIVIAPRTRD